MHAREHARLHVLPCAMWRVCADPAASVGQVLTGGDTGMLPRCGDAAAALAVSHKGCGAGDTEAATARGMSYKGRGVGASAAAPAARADRKRLVARLGVLGHAVNLAAPAGACGAAYPRGRIGLYST